MITIKKTYTLLFNFEEEQGNLVNEVTQYIGMENVKVLNYGVFGDGSKTEDMKSLWVTNEYYLVAYTAMHFAYYLDQEFIFNQDGEVNVQYAIDWHKRNLSNPSKFLIKEGKQL